jgi:hypothetical protein
MKSVPLPLSTIIARQDEALGRPAYSGNDVAGELAYKKTRHPGWHTSQSTLSRSNAVALESATVRPLVTPVPRSANKIGMVPPFVDVEDLPA